MKSQEFKRRRRREFFTGFIKKSTKSGDEVDGRLRQHIIAVEEPQIRRGVDELFAAAERQPLNVERGNGPLLLNF